LLSIDIFSSPDAFSIYAFSLSILGRHLTNMSSIVQRIPNVANILVIMPILLSWPKLTIRHTYVIAVAINYIELITMLTNRPLTCFLAAFIRFKNVSIFMLFKKSPEIVLWKIREHIIRRHILLNSNGWNWSNERN